MVYKSFGDKIQKGEIYKTIAKELKKREE